jgi:hypothetical protein
LAPATWATGQVAGNHQGTNGREASQLGHDQPPLFAAGICLCALLQPVWGVQGTNQIDARDKRFTFDAVYGPESTQDEIYDKSVQPLVTAFLSGLNASILAYGQTGAGKTYTMGSAFNELCDKDALGIIPRVVDTVLTAVEQQRGTMSSTLEVSFLEVYNEKFRDLLRTVEEPEADVLMFQRDEFGNVDLDGLTRMPLGSLKELAWVLDTGASRRKTASTKMNATSSRSHAVFTLRLEQTPIIADPEEEASASSSAAAPTASSSEASGGESPRSALGVKRVSVFRLVDLAGSERSKKTGAEGDRLREANSINQSLVTLGRCITALSEKAKYVPFRSSKLTQLLSNSLGGNSATLMVACTSPAESNEEETLMTLQYAQQAASICNKPVVNSDPNGASTMQLRVANRAMRKELLRLHQSGVAVDPVVLTRFGITNSAPVARERSFSDSLVPRSDALPVGSVGMALSAAAEAHSTSQSMRLREELMGARADVARLEAELGEARTELKEVSSRGSWAVTQATSLLDENARLTQEHDQWKLRYETIARAFAKLQSKSSDITGASAMESMNLALKEAGEAAVLEAISQARSKAVATETKEDEDAADVDDDEEEMEEEKETVCGPTDHDVAHIRSQMELRGQLQMVSDVLLQKQSLLAAMERPSEEAATSGGSNLEALREEFLAQMRQSETEVSDLEGKMRDLAAELEETKKEAARARDEGEREAKSRAAMDKDSEMKQLRSKVQSLQKAMKDASRAQQRRDREAARMETLRQEIESHKREKIRLEKVMRDSTKRYLEEKKAHERDRIIAAKRERVQALELRKARDELERQERALVAAKQRVKTMQKQEDLARSKRDSAKQQRASRSARTLSSATPASSQPVLLPLVVSSSSSSSSSLDLVSAVGDIESGAANLIKSVISSLAPLYPDTVELEEAIEVDEDGDVLLSSVMKMGVDDSSRFIMKRMLYFGVQCSAWRMVAETHSEQRDSAARELHQLLSKGRSCPDSSTRAEELRRGIVHASRRLQHAQVQIYKFQMALEGEGLAGSGWLRRVVAEAKIPAGKRKNTLAAKLLSWLMALLVRASTESLCLAGRCSHAVKLSKGTSGVSQDALAKAVADAVANAQREFKAEMWKAQCDAAVAQKDDAERIAALELELTRAKVEQATTDFSFAPSGSIDTSTEQGRALAEAVADRDRLRERLRELEDMVLGRHAKASQQFDDEVSSMSMVKKMASEMSQLQCQLEEEKKRSAAALKAPRRVSIMASPHAQRPRDEAQVPSLEEIQAKLELDGVESDSDSEEEPSQRRESCSSRTHGPTTLQTLIHTTTDRRASLQRPSHPPKRPRTALAEPISTNVVAASAAVVPVDVQEVSPGKRVKLQAAEEEDEEDGSSGDEGEFKKIPLDEALEDAAAAMAKLAASGARESVITAGTVLSQVEGKLVRAQPTNYQAPRAFGSSIARGAPEHHARVDERRRKAREALRSAVDGSVIAPARVRMALPPPATTAQPPKPPALESEEDTNAQDAAALREADKHAKARLARFMSNSASYRRGSMSSAETFEGKENDEM